MKRARSGFNPLELFRPYGRARKNNKRHLGFTIVEVMMFLAISSAMFVIAFFGMRSTQDTVAFRNSINSMEAKIRETINNVDNGYFDNAGEWVCSVNGANISINAPVAGSSGGGTSQDCIFTGKEISVTGGSNVMNIRTIISAKDSNLEIRDKAELNETYELKNAVTVKSSSTIKLEIIRDKDGAGDGDYRAKRYYYPGGIGAPQLITDIASTQPNICLIMGNSGRKAAITITDKEVAVDYDYGGSCS